jgi:hypothetical protein
MAILIQIWEIEIFLALLFTAYGILGRDPNNYTDTISCVLGFIFWMITALSSLGGITTDAGSYSASWMFWIFVSIGVITAVIAFTKLMDAMNSRNNDSHVNMGFDTRLR